MNNYTLGVWEQKMMPHLESLAAKMLTNRHFHNLKTVADLMSGLSQAGWSHLADEHKEQYLEQMNRDFHPNGMGDRYGADSDYQAIVNLIDAEYRAVKRRI